MAMKQIARGAVRALGLDLVRYSPGPAWPSDAEAGERAILERIAGLTMTSAARQLTLMRVTRHLVRRGVAGAFVECGVWRGGCMMAMALELMAQGAATRRLYGFDTFDGMTAPMPVDRRPDGRSAQALLAADPSRRSEVWAVAGLEDVRRNLATTGYPQLLLHLVPGSVETTLPRAAPAEPIALLRLDTDWYASTRHELEHLYPLLASGGALIIDDYGDWEGARQAVDEYFAALPGPPVFLNRIDETGRLVWKP
jgi:hypothetical protein